MAAAALLATSSCSLHAEGETSGAEHAEATAALLRCMVRVPLSRSVRKRANGFGLLGLPIGFLFSSKTQVCGCVRKRRRGRGGVLKEAVCLRVHPSSYV